MNGTITLQAPA